MDSFESRMNPRFLAESEKGMLWEPRVIESGRGTVEGFKEDEKGKRRASVSVVVQFELIFRHPCFYVVCACIEFFGEVVHFSERSGFLELCVICEKLMVYRVVSIQLRYLKGEGELEALPRRMKKTELWLARWKQPALEGCQGFDNLRRQIVPVGDLIVRGGGGGGEDLRLLVLQYGTGYWSGWPYLGRSFWLAWSAGAILCVYSDYVAMEFEEVAQSTFSSAFLDGHSRGWTIGSIPEVWRWWYFTQRAARLCSFGGSSTSVSEKKITHPTWQKMAAVDEEVCFG